MTTTVRELPTLKSLLSFDGNDIDSTAIKKRRNSIEITVGSVDVK